jgi:hypothetical protein
MLQDEDQFPSQDQSRLYDFATYPAKECKNRRRLSPGRRVAGRFETSSKPWGHPGNVDSKAKWLM